MEDALIEIVTKECERYRLISFGLLASVDEGVRLLQPFIRRQPLDRLMDEAFYTAWRSSVLSHFYKRLDYATFVKRHREDDAYFNFLFYQQQRLLQRMRWDYTQPTIDKDLAVPPRTLAFKLSMRMAEEKREELFVSLQEVDSPLEVERRCDQHCRRWFPLQLKELFIRFRMDDPAYWEELYILIRLIAKRVTNRLFCSIQYKREIEQDSWTETSLLVHQKVLAMEHSPFESAAHFRNYLMRVCMNKYHESERANRDPMLILDGMDEAATVYMTDMIMDCDFLSGSAWECIDQSDNSEVSRALAAILWDCEEPVYSLLVKGLEKKVEILRLHYVDGKSYDEIARMQSPSLSGVALNKLRANLRQDVVRVRKTLKERFLRMLENNK